MAKHTIFVYGTLKLGHSNNRLLETSRFLNEGFSPTTGYLLDADVFPIFIDDPSGFFIKGEYWHVSDKTLNQLDRLENEGVLFFRKTFLTPYKTPIMIYCGNPQPWSNLPRIEPVVEHDGLTYCEWTGT